MRKYIQKPAKTCLLSLLSCRNFVDREHRPLETRARQRDSWSRRHQQHTASFGESPRNTHRRDDVSQSGSRKSDRQSLRSLDSSYYKSESLDQHGMYASSRRCVWSAFWLRSQGLRKEHISFFTPGKVSTPSKLLLTCTWLQRFLRSCGLSPMAVDRSQASRRSQRIRREDPWSSSSNFMGIVSACMSKSLHQTIPKISNTCWGLYSPTLAKGYVRRISTKKKLNNTL